jgi:hypothetical protein
MLTPARGLLRAQWLPTSSTVLQRAYLVRELGDEGGEEDREVAKLLFVLFFVCFVFICLFIYLLFFLNRAHTYPFVQHSPGGGRLSNAPIPSRNLQS